MNILVINAGSSSLKYQLIRMEDESILCKGVCERIGIDGKYSYKAMNMQRKKFRRSRKYSSTVFRECALIVSW